MTETKAKDTELRTIGLKGVVAGRSAICFIDGERGILRYRGYDIHDLTTHSNYEDVVYLLWNGELPTEEQLADFSVGLATQRRLPAAALDWIRNAPTDASAMGLLRTATSALGQSDPEVEDMDPSANRRKAGRLTAQLATLVATIHRCRNGQEPVDPDPTLGHAANFLYMIHGERPDEEEARSMDAALVLHADHGFNASTFAAKVTAATLSDMHSAITSAVGTLKGPLHGGANQRVMEMLLEIGTADHVASWVDAKLEAGERIMGFGHRVYRTEDPRARHLRAMAGTLESRGDPELLRIQDRLVEVVKDRKNLNANVDFFSASLYAYLGLPREIFPLLFAISRVAGWTTHIMEQYADNKLIRPRAEYSGPGAKEYTPLVKR